MGVPLWRSAGAIRMSFGPLADEETIAAACARIERCGAALRASCLIPSERAAVPHDGLLQLGVEGACSWLVLDAASGACVVIDPLPELMPRIASYVRCQNYRVLAVVGTAPDAGRQSLVDALGDRYAGGAVDEFGWPAAAPVPLVVALEGGAAARALRLGAQVLVSMAIGAGNASRAYLLGSADGGRLPASAVRFAFSAGAQDEVLRAVSGPRTLLCPTRDDHNQFCASMTEHSPAMLTAGTQPGAASGMQLDGAELDAFLSAHPDAVLVDVREAYEFAATVVPAPGGRVAHSVPLSRLAGQASVWLHEERRPLVFFCRSGNRSMKATQCLRRLGHDQAYSLNGGLALAA
jgi:rhodanese-related sulfurtransferase